MTTITMNSIQQKRDSVPERVAGSHVTRKPDQPKSGGSQQDSEKRKDYFRDVSKMIISNFALDQVEISVLLKITRVKLAYNVLNFSYAALIQNKGDADATLRSLRSVSKYLYETASEQGHDAEAMDYALRKHGLPPSSTSMPSLLGIEILNILHNAPAALMTFQGKLCAKYADEYGSLDLNEFRTHVERSVGLFFPEDEAATAIVFLNGVDVRGYRKILTHFDQALDYFKVFNDASEAELNRIVGNRPDVKFWPDMKVGNRTKIQKFESYRSVLQELLKAN